MFLAFLVFFEKFLQSFILFLPAGLAEHAGHAGLADDCFSFFSSLENVF